MQLKQFIQHSLTLAAVLCCAIMTTVFTACSNDNDGDEIVKYWTETVGSNAIGDQVCAQMDAALSSAFGGGVAYKRDDSKAIRVCDEVANKVRDVELLGTINLMVVFPSSDPDATNNKKVIKTYEFPF